MDYSTKLISPELAKNTDPSDFSPTLTGHFLAARNIRYSIVVVGENDTPLVELKTGEIPGRGPDITPEDLIKNQEIEFIRAEQNEDGAWELSYKIHASDIVEKPDTLDGTRGIKRKVYIDLPGRHGAITHKVSTMFIPTDGQSADVIELFPHKAPDIVTQPRQAARARPQA